MYPNLYTNVTALQECRNLGIINVLSQGLCRNASLIKFLTSGDFSSVDTSPKNYFNSKCPRCHYPLDCLLYGTSVGNSSFHFICNSPRYQIGRKFGIFYLIDSDINFKIAYFLTPYCFHYSQNIFLDVFNSCSAPANNYTRSTYSDCYNHTFMQSFNLIFCNTRKFKF